MKSTAYITAEHYMEKKYASLFQKSNLNLSPKPMRILFYRHSSELLLSSCWQNWNDSCSVFGAQLSFRVAFICQGRDGNYPKALSWQICILVESSRQCTIKIVGVSCSTHPTFRHLLPSGIQSLLVNTQDSYIMYRPSKNEIKIQQKATPIENVKRKLRSYFQLLLSLGTWNMTLHFICTQLEYDYHFNSQKHTTYRSSSLHFWIAAWLSHRTGEV